MRELEYFQNDRNDWQSNRRYRLAILVILFNNENFPVNEQIKQRLKKLLYISDFERLEIKEEYKYIWQAFMKKIDHDSQKELEIAIDLTLKDA